MANMKISDLTTQTGGALTTDLLELETASGNSRKTTAKNLRTYPLGDGPSVVEGSNATMGAASLVGGTVTVSTTKVTANSRIFLTAQAAGGTAGELTISARVAGTSFTILSGSGSDTRSIAWMIVEPG